jgi:ribonuclease HI
MHTLTPPAMVDTLPHVLTPADAAPILEVVEIWSAGLCRPNPGAGGFAALLRYEDGREACVSGGKASTAPRAELQAAILAFETLTTPCRITYHARGEGLYLGMIGRAEGWRFLGWRNAKNETISNADLWKQLLAMAAPHDVTWRLVPKGCHDEMNARVIALAGEGRERRSLRRTYHAPDDGLPDQAWSLEGAGAGPRKV